MSSATNRNNHITALVHVAGAGRPAGTRWAVNRALGALLPSRSSLVVGDPAPVGREGEETMGGLFLFLFFFFLPFSSSVFLHGLGRLPGFIFSSLKHFAEEG